MHLTLPNESLITSVYHMQMSRCVRYWKCSSTLQRKQPSLIIQKVDDFPHWVIMVMPDECVCVCTEKSSIFPPVSSWQALRAPDPRFNSSCPPHLLTTWSSCAMLNITWQEAHYPVCFCVCRWWGVFPTVLAAVRTSLIIIFFWNVTFQTQWPRADRS